MPEDRDLPPESRTATAGVNRRLTGVATLLRRLAPRASFVESEILGLSTLAGPGAVCLDVGAEYGLYTYTLAELVGDTGAVHSFEPLPGPARFLAAGIRALGCGNVTQHRVALGAHPGQGTMSLPSRRGVPVHGRAFLTEGASGLGPNAEFSGARDVRVGVTTLDEVCEHEEIERVHLIKADVEGAELAVLEGAEKTLAKDQPAVLLEIEERHLAKYGASADGVAGWMAKRGYRMHVWTRGAWAGVDEVTPAWRNYLFVP